MPAELGPSGHNPHIKRHLARRSTLAAGDSDFTLALERVRFLHQTPNWYWGKIAVAFYFRFTNCLGVEKRWYVQLPRTENLAACKSNKGASDWVATDGFTPQHRLGWGRSSSAATAESRRNQRRRSGKGRGSGGGCLTGTQHHASPRTQTHHTQRERERERERERY